MQPVEPGAGTAERAAQAAAEVVREGAAATDVAALAAEDDGLSLGERARESETNVISGLSVRETGERREERTPGANKQ